MGSARPLTGHSILVLEDEPLVALDVVENLQNAGADVVVAHRVADALKLANLTEFSAAVLDFRVGSTTARKFAFCFASAASPSPSTRVTPLSRLPGRTPRGREETRQPPRARRERRGIVTQVRALAARGARSNARSLRFKTVIRLSLRFRFLIIRPLSLLLIQAADQLNKPLRQRLVRGFIQLRVKRLPQPSRDRVLRFGSGATCDLCPGCWQGLAHQCRPATGSRRA
jgi:CheY-like chemotaxis protein